MLAAVGLDPTSARRYPHEFSGGQLRRVALARILLLQPRVADARRADLGPRYVGPGDGAQSAAATCGSASPSPTCSSPTTCRSSSGSPIASRSCISAASSRRRRPRELFAHPTHPYTRILLAAAPRLNGRRASDPIAVRGDPPSAPPILAGCAFVDRCPLVEPVCRSTVPRLTDTALAHRVACHVSTVDSAAIVQSASVGAMHRAS